mmetsp:Transcript_32310/g.74433  ORF Transcript_32310/g.74433 Transcript_32310/m.74433 type:complete len:110 (+) Transcript_32310:961-1290(+)
MFLRRREDPSPYDAAATTASFSVVVRNTGRAKKRSTANGIGYISAENSHISIGSALLFVTLFQSLRCLMLVYFILDTSLSCSQVLKTAPETLGHRHYSSVLYSRNMDLS